jgi:hypothetical protein
MRRSYVSLYFSQLYCMESAIGIDLSSYFTPKSKPLLLQSYTVMAGATRVFAEDPSNSQHLDFEYKARQLASELFDHVDIETAVGLHLLSHHTMTHDFEKAEHYRDMASSMCHRIKRRGGLDMGTRSRLLRLEMINSSLRRFYQPLRVVASDYDRMMEEAQSITDPTGSLENLVPLLHFIAMFRSIIIDTRSIHPNGPPISFRPISDEEMFRLGKVFDEKVSSIVHRVFAPPNQTGLTTACLDMVKAIFFFAGNRTRDALALLHQASGLLEQSIHFWPYTSSHLADLVHMCFLVAFTARNRSLASTFNRFQHLLMVLFPSTSSDCLRDEALLATIPKSEETDNLWSSDSSEHCSLGSIRTTEKTGTPSQEAFSLAWMEGNVPSFEEILDSF